MVPFPWSHPLFQPKPGNIGVLDLTESRIICPTSSPPDQDHLRKGRIFHLKNPMRLFPSFFSPPSKPGISCSSYPSCPKVPGRAPLTRGTSSLPYFSSSCFPSDFHDIFPHLSPPPNPTNSLLLAAQREPGAGDRSWECCPGFLESFIPAHSRIPLCLSSLPALFWFSSPSGAGIVWGGFFPAVLIKSFRASYLEAPNPARLCL